MDSLEETPLNNVTLVHKKKTLKEKCRYLKENITVEPIVTCHIIPAAISRLAMQNLNLDKTCRASLEFGDAICDSVINKKGILEYQHQEEAIQSMVALMDSWKQVLQAALPCILLLFIGSWSDKTGKRKICILVPIIGEFLMCLSNLLSTYFFYEIPVQFTMFMEGFLPAITGGWMVGSMAAFSYLCDITNEESRTYRIGILQICLVAAAPLGLALSGILLDLIGYYGVFSIAALLNLFSICYGYFYIKDLERTAIERDTKDQSTGILQSLKFFFDVKHVKETICVAFKSGPNKRRTKSILVFVAVFFVVGSECGEYAIRYMFTRLRFHWNAVKYSYYLTVFIMLHTIGGYIIIHLFRRNLSWDDSCLGLISISCKFISNTCTGLATSHLLLFIALIPETFTACSVTALRTISSKLVNSSESGKITSFFHLVEIVTRMVFSFIYSMTYMESLKSNNEGFVFFLTIGLLTIPFCIFLWFFYNSKGKKGDVSKNDNTGKSNYYVKCNLIIEEKPEDRKTTAE